MTMTAAEIRLKANPILSSMLLGMGQGTMIAEKLMPRLPQVLASVNIAQMGDAARRRYNLRRAPGTATKRINIKYDGQVYTVEQYAVEVPIPRELLREADESRRLNIAGHLDISQIAMTTASDVLALDYELEVAGIATSISSYAAGHTLALAGGTKWSAATGTPVTDVRAAAEIIRKKTGKRPNKLVMGADVLAVVCINQEVRSYLPSTQTGPASVEQLKTIFNVAQIEVGDASWVDETDEAHDVWGNNAILAYVPNIAPNSAKVSLAEPAFGFTNVIEGHPYSEAPYFDNGAKSWIFGGTFERRANIAYKGAGFLFTNPA